MDTADGDSRKELTTLDKIQNRNFRVRQFAHKKSWALHFGTLIDQDVDTRSTDCTWSTTAFRYRLSIQLATAFPTLCAAFREKFALLRRCGDDEMLLLTNIF